MVLGAGDPRVVDGEKLAIAKRGVQIRRDQPDSEKADENAGT